MTEDLIIYRKPIPAREPEYADFPEKLHPDIVKFLKNHGIEKLYIHQTEAYEQAAEGKNLVITTPTASGKSLCFYLPVIDAILKEPLTRALFVYPTKALAISIELCFPGLNFSEGSGWTRESTTAILHQRREAASANRPTSF